MVIRIEGVQRIYLHTARCGAELFIKRYRDVSTFEAYCKECPIYGATWACPPFESNAQIDLSSYHSVTLFGFQAFITLPFQKPVESPEVLQQHSEGVMRGVRRHLDPLLLAVERSTPNSRVFLPGSCRLCDDSGCTRTARTPCRYPERMRSSLEAIGFNIALAAENLLHLPLCWPANLCMPPYLTLLAALFHAVPAQETDLTALNAFIDNVVE